MKASFDEKRRRLLTERDAAAYLSCTVKWLQKMRYNGGGPRYLKLSARMVRYDPDDLTSFVNSCARTSTSDVDER